MKGNCFKKALALGLCLCLIVGSLALGDPAIAHGAEPKFLSKIKVTATAKSRYPSANCLDQAEYKKALQEIKANYESYTSEKTALVLSTREQLAAFAAVANEGQDPFDFEGKYVKLANDIDLKGTKPTITESDDQNFTVTIDGEPDNVWTPIGKVDRKFKGTFDGDHHVITGMVVVAATNLAYCGFFGYIKDGTVRNLGIENSFVASTSYGGGLVGYLSGNEYLTGDERPKKGIIESCYATGEVYTSAFKPRAGGLMGTNSYGTVKSSYAAGSVYVSSSEFPESSSYGGGLAGEGHGGIIENSYATATVYAFSKGSDYYSRAYGGGLVGYHDYGDIKSSYAMGAVYAASSDRDSYGGGLVGDNVNTGREKYGYYNSAAEIQSGINTEMGTPLIPEEMTGEGKYRADEEMVGFEKKYWSFRHDAARQNLQGGKQSQTLYYPKLKAFSYKAGNEPAYVKTGYPMENYFSSMSVRTPAEGASLEADLVKKAPLPADVGMTDLVYQWYVGGEKISGATADTYTLREQDLGKFIEVKVTSPQFLGQLSATLHTIAIKAGSHMTRDKNSGAEIQGFTNNDPIQSVVYTADAGYYFPETYQVAEQSGLRVSRNSTERITVEGTPTADVKFQLAAATKKAEQSAPSGLREDERSILGTTAAMEYASAPSGAAWTPCTEGRTAVNEGDWYVRYQQTADKNASPAAKITVKARHSVTILNPADLHLKHVSGSETQSGIIDGTAMKPVVYAAASGYYFPETYRVAKQSGLRVSRDSVERITIAGTPTADVRFQLAAAAKKANQKAPSGLKDGRTKILGTTAAMEYAASAKSSGWKLCKNGSTPVKEGIWYVRYKETDTKNAGAAAKVTVINVPATPKARVSTTYNSAKVSWNKVKGAANYQVYRATKKNGKYKKMKTTAKTTWTNQKLGTGKTYWYKVRAYKKIYGKTVYSGFSQKLKAVPRTKAPVFTLTAGNNKIKVAWKKASGADGYRIYRSKSKNGKYKLIKDSRSLLRRYTSINLSDKHRYYYKMRSYKIVKGKKVYSAYSAIKSKKTK